MAISAGDLTTLRTKQHRSDVRLSVSQPSALLTAQVNNSSIARGDTAIAYDTGTGSGYSRITAGNALVVTTTYGPWVVRVKSITGNQTSGTITVAANDIKWGDNDVIVIYEDWRDYPVIPRFTADGTFYKDYSDTYTDENSQPPPVCIAGPHRVGDMASGTITFAIDLTNSYAIADGATISSYGCTVQPSSGASVTNTGAGTYDIDITTAGQYWMVASCTDSNGKTQTTYRRLFAHDSSTQPYKDVKIDTLSGSQQRGGWSLRITVYGAADSSEFIDRALVLLWQRHYFGTTEQIIGGPTGGENLLFAGYIVKDSIGYDAEKSVVRFEAVTIENLLRELYNRSVSLEAVSSPSTWYEYATWLTSARALHHLWRWHSTLLEMADVYGLTLDTGLKRKFADVSAGDLLTGGKSLLRSIQAYPVTNKAGQMYIVQDAQLLGSSARSALSTVAELTTKDLIEEVDIAPRTARGVKVRVSGLYFDGATSTPYLSKAPGDTYDNHGGSVKDEDRLVLSSQTQANELAGRFMAVEYNDYPEVRGSLPGGYIPSLDIIGNEWWTLSIASGDTIRGITWSSKKLLCRTVRVRGDFAGGALTADADFDTEAQGPDGQTETWETDPPSNTDISYPPLPAWDLPPIEPPTGEEPVPFPYPQTPVANPNIMTWGDDGVHFFPNSGTWTARNGVSGAAVWGCIDPWRVTVQGQNTQDANPLAATVFRLHSGAIYRSLDGGQNWVDVTPQDDPPNSWGDVTAPTKAAVTFFQIEPSYSTSGTFTVGVRWQETDSGSSKWRAWLLQTTDKGETWEWFAIAVPSTTPLDQNFDFDDGKQGWVEIDDGSFIGVNPVDTVYGTDYEVQCAGDSRYGSYAFYGIVPYGSLDRTLTVIEYPQKISFSEIDFYARRHADFWYRVWTSSDRVTWTLVSQDLKLSGPACFIATAYNSSGSAPLSVTNKYVRVGCQHNLGASTYVRGCIYELRFKNFETTGYDDLRFLWTDGEYAVVLADDAEIRLITIDTSVSSGFSSDIYIADATNAEIDAGTYSAAGFVDLDAGNVYVFGRFDCTNGDTGLSGVHHAIVYDGSTWTAIENSWSTDECGAFLAGVADDGGNRRYWAIRNNAADCQLYSGIGGALSLISTVAGFNVSSGGLYILDGQQMVVAGQSAASGAIVYETVDGGSTWTDITDVHPTTGVEKIQYF